MTRVAVRNAADPEQTKKAGRKDKSRSEQEQEDLHAVLSTPAGRRFVHRIIDHSGLYRQSFDGTSRTYFAEGERNVALWLLAEVKSVAPRAYLTMLGEQIETEGE